MSDFVEFPEEKYVAAGNVFEKFNAGTSTFTLENALAMMWFAQLAYEVDETGGNRNAQKIETVREKWGFASITPFQKRAVGLASALHTTGLIGERHDAIVLAFAGTDPAIWETVATDARFKPGVRNTHEGFQAAFDAVGPVDSQTNKVSGLVGDAIARVTDKKPLFITGHSLGAALGILTAAAAVKHGIKPQAVYGFGTPRPGNSVFQHDYNAVLGDVTYRLVHGRDIVARVPFFFDYCHVGRLLKCPQHTKFHAGELTGISTDPVLSSDYRREIARFLLGGGLVGAIKSLFANPPTKLAELAQAVKAQLPERGQGPLAPWFRLLPPFIREHLEDQYIEALTPGAIKIRDD
jgi:triacylglycerol lipase